MFSTLKIIAAIPLPRFERATSGVPFAYSLYGVVFVICSKMATGEIHISTLKIISAIPLPRFERENSELPSKVFFFC